MQKYLDIPSVSSSRISRIQIDGLFNKHSYDIKFDDWLVIMIGPNGYGKTTILRMLNYIFNYHYSLLLPIQFKSIYITFSNGVKFGIIKSNNGLSLDLNSETPELYSPTFSNDYSFLKIIGEYIDNKDLVINNPVSLYSLLDIIIPEGKNIDRPLWLYQRILADPQIQELIQSFAKNIQFLSSNEQKAFYQQCISKLREFRDLRRNVTTHYQTNQSLISKIHFIQANRIINIISSSEHALSHPIRDPLDQISIEISDVIDNFNRMFSRNFASGSWRSSRITDMHLERFESILKYYPNLFSDEVYINIRSFIERKSVPHNLNHPLLKFYKLHKFITFINDIDDLRYTFYLKRSLHIKEKIELNELSSGEKNILIMLFEVLFRAFHRTLVLIDEPEISLHLGLQVEFTNLLQKTESIMQQNYLIATHSPDIIHNKYNNLYDMVNKIDR